MTAQQLRHIRESRNWTRDELAAHLQGCTAQAIVKWERNERPVPVWVAEKLLRTTEITLPLADMYDLLNAAKDQNKPFEAVLTDAIRSWIQRNTPAPPTTYPLPSDEAPQATAAETPTDYGPDD
jgi:transcriptional regulator with XRE-family HTH domain